MLWTMEEQFLILVNPDALAAGKEPDFICSRSEDCNAKKCVGGSLYDGHLSEDRSEVGVVSAVKSCAVPKMMWKGRSHLCGTRLNLSTVRGLVTETLAPLSITPGSSILAHMPGAMVAVNSVGGSSSL